MASLLKHTVAPSGGDFTNLDACFDHLVASHANFVTADVYGEIEIVGDWSGGPDTATVTTAGLTLDATRYLSIYADAANFASASWDAGKYRLETANATGILVANSVALRMNGLQVAVTAANGHYQSPIYAGAATAGSVLWVSNCLLKQCANGTYRLPCFVSEDADRTIYFWNNVLYGMGSTDHASSSAYWHAAGISNIYSCVIIGGKYGVNCTAGTVNVKNTYAGGTLTEDFYRAAGTLAKTNCASEDQSADDTSGADETATDCVAAAVAYDADTFVSVTGGSEDYHLAADGNSPLMGVGVSTTGESAPLDFTTNIDGETRDATWDIGADSWVASGTAHLKIINE